MASVSHRIVIYPKDVALITGMTPGTARKLLGRIRRRLGKPHRALVTIAEFCDYMGFKEEWIKPFLQ